MREAKRTLTQPPSSKGCHNCRARRVKCDERLPACRRCVAHGKQCVYRSQVLWLPETAGSEVPAIDIQHGINTRPLERLQMLASVLAHHFPSSRPEAKWAQRASILGRLPAMDLSSPLVSNAVDSLCFAFAGSQQLDERLLAFSRVCYGNVLGALVREIQNPHARRQASDHRRILYSIVAISRFGHLVLPIDRPQNGGETHYWGVHQYLVAVGPSALELSNEFDRRLYLNLRITLIFLTLARRTALVFDRPDWKRAIRQSMPSLRDLLTDKDWYQVASPIPGLLGQADQLLCRASEQESSQMLKTFRDLLRACQGLNIWISEELNSHTPRSVALQDRRAFDMRIEEHCFMATSEEVFLEYPCYCDIAILQRVMVMWLFCLHAHCTALRFFGSKRFIKECSSDFDTDLKAVQADACRCATNLCTAVYSLSMHRSIARAQSIIILLESAHAFFEDFGADREAKWCRGCMAATNSRIKRISTSEPATICRVADLSMNGAGLANNARYRWHLSDDSSMP